MPFSTLIFCLVGREKTGVVLSEEDMRMLGSRVSSINDDSKFASSCWSSTLRKPSFAEICIPPKKRPDLETSRVTRRNETTSWLTTLW